MISRETIDRIFDAARVEDVIGDFVVLKRAGQNLKGLSPFVTEKTPSFVVSPVKQIWKDFSTGKGGNAVGFLMELESYTYPEALRFLARRYNIEIEEDKLDEQGQKEANEKESLFLVSEYASNYFHDTLLNSQRGKAIGLAYFKERGFRQETIEKFKLGYSPDEWTAFTDSAISKGYSIDFLGKSGLTIVKDQGKMFDRFKGRIMFPIQSITGRILGFGGRTLLTDKKVAKYLNSPESPIYHKSNILYGIFQSKGSIVKNDNCYLVEGYTDVISMHQNGIENVVASSGTSLTVGQINLIKRYTDNITVLYDGDSAGIKASFRGIDLILEQDMNVKVLTFPDGHDPDSYSRLVTTTELKEYLEKNSTDFIKFKVGILLEDAQGDPIKRAGLIRDIVHSIVKITDPIKREVYVQETSGLLNIQEDILLNEIAQIEAKENRKLSQQRSHNSNQYSNKNSTPPSSVQSTVQPPNQGGNMHVVHNQDPNEMPLEAYGDYVESVPAEQVKTNNTKNEQEIELMTLMLRYGDVKIEVSDEIEETNEKGDIELKTEIFETTVLQEIVERLQEDEVTFKNDMFADVLNEVIEGLNVGEIRNASYFNKHQNQQIVSFVADILSDKYELSKNWKKKNIHVVDRELKLSQATQQTILNFKKNKISELINEIANALKSPKDNAERVELIIKFQKLYALQRMINEKLNGITL
ncbi:MAG: DNA primase [Ichthyobacteriaceae bacterium]|nr:DNA primase [Ichthyobacteriaceae bacterium]